MLIFFNRHIGCKYDPQFLITSCKVPNPYCQLVTGLKASVIRPVYEMYVLLSAIIDKRCPFISQIQKSAACFRISALYPGKVNIAYLYLFIPFKNNALRSSGTHIYDQYAFRDIAVCSDLIGQHTQITLFHFRYPLFFSIRPSYH